MIITVVKKILKFIGIVGLVLFFAIGAFGIGLIMYGGTMTLK